MTRHLEASLQEDLEEIRRKIAEMGELVEASVRGSIKAVLKRDRQAAYGAILRDSYIDDSARITSNDFIL